MRGSLLLTPMGFSFPGLYSMVYWTVPPGDKMRAGGSLGIRGSWSRLCLVKQRRQKTSLFLTFPHGQMACTQKLLCCPVISKCLTLDKGGKIKGKTPSRLILGPAFRFRSPGVELCLLVRAWRSRCST